MVDIISKHNGPRREDAAMRRLLSENRATITRLADHLSNGAYSAKNAPREGPKPAGLIIHDLGQAKAAEQPRPHIRTSLNGRVVMVDQNSGRQMHHIGEIRMRDGRATFVLASAANGFFAPVDEEIESALLDLDGRALDEPEAEDKLAHEIGLRLGME